MSKSQPIVLLVDDEPAIRDMIDLALERAGTTVHSGTNAQEVLVAISVDV